MEPFVHLHVHSQYSILDGQASIDTILSKAMDDGMPGIALTDHGAMFGIKEFYNTLKKKKSKIKAEITSINNEIKALEEKSRRSAEDNIQRDKLIEKLAILEKKAKFKGIIGCEAYCARRTRFDKDSNVKDNYKPNRSIDFSGWHIILLAKNLQGYKNLIKMISYSWTEGYYYKPRIDKELLEKYHEGIIVSTACLGGEISQHIIHGHPEEASKTIEWFKSIFGEDFYLEVQRHKTDNPAGNQTVYPIQEKVNKVMLELSEKHNVKVIATNDVHFANEEDAEAHDRLICLSTRKELDDPNRLIYTKQEWLKTTEEMNKIFSDIPFVLRNTTEIIDKVEEYSIDHEALMPDFPIPEGFADDDDYLRYLTYEGAKKKYKEEGLTQEVRDRIDFELETIKSMGFPGYFLIVQDFIAAARSMGVLVGPGRGSAAGSAVAYCLNITNIDPIEYDLLFERFLNPDRISMPDIDIDFDDDGRGDVLQWVTDKYGKERVAHIITYGTMATKSALKDVARVTGLPLAESNRLTKLIPDKIDNVKHVTLRAAIENVPELKAASLSPDKKLFDTIKYAQQLEGSVRNTGVHACGIIIGKTDISDVVPVFTVADKDTGEDMLVTQYEGSVIEETGLIKMDFLGLRTLSVIKEALANIEKRHSITIDIDSIPKDDAKTFELYSQGDTIGTFQFESAGMRKYLKELQPTRFEDLIAMNALYRPGPLQYIPSFIKRKHGLEKIDYDLPCLERYLNTTYGVTVYQEQVMLLSREIAGFTRGESDSLRKAMGKKLKDKMDALKEKFLKGGTANGYSVDKLEKVWSDWEKFAEYAFNKSHSTCYSWVAYQTAYLKANYPAEYMAGALSSNLNNSDEISKLMTECKAMGISVLVPDVNESSYKFSVNKNGEIRFGLSAIKGVGRGAADAIINEREKNGLFEDIFDFFRRIDTRSCNKKVMESLANSGAFDLFGIKREAYFLSSKGDKDNFLSQLIKYNNDHKSDSNDLQGSLFDFDDECMQVPPPEIPIVTEEQSLLTKLKLEKELVGIYLSDHPLEPYRVILDAYCNTTTDVAQLNEGDVGANIRLAGIVSDVFQGMTKRNIPYGKMTLEDREGTIDIAFWGDDYLKFREYLLKDMFVLIIANVQRDYRNDPCLKVSSIDFLEKMKDNLISQVSINIDIDSLDEENTIYNELSEILSDNIGNATLNITLGHKTIGSVDMQYPRRIDPNNVRLLDFCKGNDFMFKVS